MADEFDEFKVNTQGKINELEEKYQDILSENIKKIIDVENLFNSYIESGV
jgi:hypothetical protein